MKKTFLLALAALPAQSIMAQKIQYPQTQQVAQKDNYFGREISDPYRWLEDDTAKQTAMWVKAQNKITQSYLANIPFRQQLKERLTKLWDYPKMSAPQKEGAYFLTYRNDGLQNQSVLYVQKGIDGEQLVLLDPNKLSSDGTVALQETAVSRKQQYFAYAVSASGSDWQEIYVMDMATRSLLSDKLSYVKFTGIAWKGDEGFYYSGYDRPENEATKYSAKTEFQKVYYHKIGTPQSEDVLIYEDKEHPLRYVSAQLTEDERFLILNISEGTDGAEIKVRDLHNKSQSGFSTLVAGFNTNAGVVDNAGDRLLLYTNEGAPNFRLLSVDPAHPQDKKVVIPEQDAKLEGVSTGGGHLFAQYLRNACTEVKQYTMEGTLEHKIELPGLGTASGFGAHKDDHYFYYSFTSYTYAPTIFRYDITTGKSVLYKRSDAPFDPNLFETEQVFYPSKDGKKVSMFIVHKKGLSMNGQNPTILYGYGGFNISLTPAFSVSLIPFLEAGGIYCVANLRGGGEYGEEWHKEGMLSRKQTVFDDFIAAAEYLIAQRYTSSAKLAIRGGSNGGLLVGACLTQRPDLFAVAIPQVGVLDMLRYHKFTVGWGWAVEYGSSDKEDDFKYLIRYSPLHNVKKGTCYPATMVTTADHDDRVVPAHSFKFAATLQAAQGCDRPVLIRIDEKAGHGAGKPTAKLIEEAADILSFVLYNTGETYKGGDK
ncbi:prolyl oligopeptidase family serine peptidase [Rurimicrobium arvi]|uniref:prolyl oligopeptidase n=1 Tax=Rurimicrobium arvi TaxID=2049916 RepID=A0ABP8MPY0_9BACT